MSLKTYFPAGRTTPGSSTGRLNVTTVFLFHSSPEAGKANSKAQPSTNSILRNIRALLSSAHSTLKLHAAIRSALARTERIRNCLLESGNCRGFRPRRITQKSRIAPRTFAAVGRLYDGKRNHGGIAPRMRPRNELRRSGRAFVGGRLRSFARHRPRS